MTDLSKYLNCEFFNQDAIPYTKLKTSGFTVKDLFLKLFTDDVYLNNVSTKMEYICDKIKRYNDGGYVKSKALKNFIPHFQKYIEYHNSLKNSDIYLVVVKENMYVQKYKVIHGYYFCNDFKRSCNKQERVKKLFSGIICLGKKYDDGLDEILADILLKFDWNSLYFQPKSLQEIIGMQYANKVNSTKDKIGTLISIPEKILRNKFFKMHLSKDLQRALFNKYDDGCSSISYDRIDNCQKIVNYIILNEKRYICEVLYPTKLKRYVYIYNSDLEVIKTEEYEYHDPIYI